MPFDSCLFGFISYKFLCRKTFDNAEANAVIGKLGQVSRDKEVWKTLLDCQLFPVSSYGCHPWDKRPADHVVDPACRESRYSAKEKLETRFKKLRPEY